MLLGIFLLIRGRQEVVLGVVVDHGLCENLVLLAALEILQVFLHKCGHLIHVEGNLRDLGRLYMGEPV